jgi:hypothetical protein
LAVPAGAAGIGTPGGASPTPWYDPEYKAFGYRTDHRVSRFGEAIGIIDP